MKNPAQHIRKSLFSLLGSLGTPAYENGESQGEKVFIELGEFTVTGANNKHQFGHSGYQVIEVVSEQPKASRKVVDELGESVMNLVKPTPRANELLSDDDFQVFVRGVDINHIKEDSGEGSKIIRLILRFNLLIKEKR